MQKTIQSCKHRKKNGDKNIDTEATDFCTRRHEAYYRISLTNAEATNSSNDEEEAEEAWNIIPARRCGKRLVKAIKIRKHVRKHLPS